MSEAEVRSRYETGSLMQVRITSAFERFRWLTTCARHQLRVDQMKVRVQPRYVINVSDVL